MPISPADVDASHSISVRADIDHIPALAEAGAPS